MNSEPFQTPSGLAYRKYVPNRVAIGLPMTAKGEGDWIGLPFLSILKEPATAEAKVYLATR